MIKLISTAVFVAALPIAASAASIISDGDIMLGVNDTGSLNVPGGPASPVDGSTVVGLRYMPTGNEATSHGCLCEGWGVGIADGGGAGIVSGGDGGDNSGGPFNLTVDSFVSTGSTATSVTSLTTGELRVTHDFMIAPETPDLYRVTVSIENTSGAAIDDLRYTRAMDWDVEPTTFDEYVTIGGTAAATAVLLATDNGFDNPDPFATRAPILASGDFVDSGPADHGALFDFGFGALGIGESMSFEIFYGGSKTEAGAFAALAAVGAEVYSFGQTSNDPLGLGLDDGAGNPTNTFIFAFAGVGGDPIPSVPVPAAGLLMLGALSGLGAMGARRRRKS